MCTVSNVMEPWLKPNSPNYPGTLPGYPYPKVDPTFPLNPYIPAPNVDPIPLPTVISSGNVYITPTLAQQMLDIIKRLDALDKKLGLIDCKLQEPEKKAYIKALRKVAGKKKRKSKAKKLLNESGYSKPGVGG